MVLASRRLSATLQVNGCRHFCQAEVKYLDVPALRHEEIGGFDIAMNDPYGVYCLQSIGYLNGQGKGYGCLQRMPGNTVAE